MNFTILLSFANFVISSCFMSSNCFSYCKSSFQLHSKRDFSPPAEKNDMSDNPNGLVYTVELPRRAGINWGSDMSFRWIYALDVEKNSPAYESGMIKKGDYIISFGNTSTLGQDFDFVLTALTKQEPILNYTFFRGTKDQLIGASGLTVTDPTKETYSVLVKQKGKPDMQVPCQGGSNLRNILLSNGVNVYRSFTRFTNCNGKQRCGTCIVDVTEGGANCTRKSLDEAMTLAENPETYRLSCITSVYGDITVEVQGIVGAAQWTK